MKDFLLGKTLNELEELVRKADLPSYTARQIADWLYKKQVRNVDGMTNLSKSTRAYLSENYEVGYADYTDKQVSTDGTIKYLFETHLKKYVETVYIPDNERHTLCVSSQVGCKMGCLFCMTAKQGFQGNLSANGIINQILNLPESEKLTNLVFMGMGEPLDNLEELLKTLDILTADYGFGWSPKRITVSTIGIVPGMERFLNESKCHLAVSLHTPFEDERKQLMPIENVYPLTEVIETIKSFDFNKQRRVSFEYIMFRGINDTNRHVNQLVRLLNGISCRINLIRFHPIPDTPLMGSDDVTIENFKHALNRKGITTTLRASRGQDIFAACGLLSTKKLIKTIEPDY